MIKTLEIKNFQSHEDSYLEFDKGVNIIVGSSDSGKTAIIRALRWLIYNRPLGDAIRSTWGGKTSVALFTDDAHIVRSKNKEEEYVLGDTHFKAFKTDVPEEISKVLNLNDINIQNQLDAPFLLSESPGAVASHFNKIANLDKIDTSLMNINSWIRELTANIKYQEADEIKYNGELKKFEYLETFEKEVSALENKEKELTAETQKKEKLTAILENLFLIADDIGQEEPLLELEKPVDDVLKLIELRAETDLQEVRLDKLVDNIQSIQEEIAELSKLILLEKPVDDIVKLSEEADEVNSQRIRLNKLLSEISDTNDTLKVKSALYDTLETSFEETMPKGSICPLCGQIIKR